MEKKKIAVFFGERSFEHDISILTGLQALAAVDTTKYEPFPVYIDMNRNWWTGSKLLDKSIYPLSGKPVKNLIKVRLETGNGDKRPALIPCGNGLFATKKPIEFDFALLAFHGDYGETGAMQGLFEVNGIPYSGARIMATSVFMSKTATKRICKAIGVPVLDDMIINRPKDGEMYDIEKIAATVKLPLPLCVKPCNLGSSIAVSKVNSRKELEVAIMKVFALDSQVLIEPFVENLEEYNISVSRAFGEFRHSVIERPLKKGEGALTFEDKYKNGGKGGKGGKLGGKVGGAKAAGGKMSATESQGMFSLSRVKNPPELTQKQTDNIVNWSKALFLEVEGHGAPRIDFLCNTKTGEMWLGEVNPIPGSFAFYLWDDAEPKVNFTKLLDALIEEGFHEKEKGSKAYWSLTENRIFKK